MVLRKKEVYTVITPIPGFIPRQLAIDILHSHSETITLNPLVLSHRQITAPRDAIADEYFSTWYEITERVQYIPGLGRLGSGIISFNGCFHDMPWGLQTHIYAPANVDLRVKYRIAGNQPGVEPPERASGGQEIGLAELGAPADGLYLREDIEIKCNIAMVGLVKSQMKAASKEMVARIIKKAELLDAGVLRAMIEDGKIKTVNPRDKPESLPPGSPFSPPLSPSMPYQVPRPMSVRQQQQPGSRPGTSGSQYQYPYNDPPKYRQAPQTAELPDTEPTGPQRNPASGAVMMELPGDYYHASPSLQPAPKGARDRTSTASSHLSHRSSLAADARNSSQSGGGGWRYSTGGGGQPSPSLNGGGGGSQRTSYTSVSDIGSGGLGSPGFPDPNAKSYNPYANELPTHRETPEDFNHDDLRPAPLAPAPYKAYNPADYARMSR